MKISNLGQRVLTAVFAGGMLVSVLIFAGMRGTQVFAGVIALAMAWEFSSMTFDLKDKRIKQWVLLALVTGLHLLFPRFGFEAVWWALLALLAYFLFATQTHGESQLSSHATELMFAVLGLVFFATTPLFLVLIRALPDGLHWLFIFLVINWAGDTGAYFGGRMAGRHRLYALVSPKKSVEGAVFGTLSSVLAAWIYQMLTLPEVSWVGVGILAAGVSVAAQVGDLCESLLKRAFHVKDSGSLLPGHGGFLDRFDGVVFSLPLMYAGLKILL